MTAAVAYKPGDLVKARGREWVVLPETRADLVKLRPLGGSEDDAALIYLPLEPEPRRSRRASTCPTPPSRDPRLQRFSCATRCA